MQVDPGVIIMGYKGDPVLDDTSLPSASQRPSWTKDGSIMAFRKLEQDVPGFQAYLEEHGKKWRDWAPSDQELSDEEGSELFGARMIGRWKSVCNTIPLICSGSDSPPNLQGAPLALAHYRDDPQLADDPDRCNDFDYSVPGFQEPSDIHCPFTAHIRKTCPRNLGPYMKDKFWEATSIIRAGIPYGPAVRWLSNLSSFNDVHGCP